MKKFFRLAACFSLLGSLPALAETAPTDRFPSLTATALHVDFGTLTPSPSPTASPIETAFVEPTSTATPVPTAEAMETAAPEATATATHTPSAVETIAPVATATPVPVETETPEPLPTFPFDDEPVSCPAPEPEDPLETAFDQIDDACAMEGKAPVADDPRDLKSLSKNMRSRVKKALVAYGRSVLAFRGEAPNTSLLCKRRTRGNRDVRRNERAVERSLMRTMSYAPTRPSGNAVNGLCFPGMLWAAAASNNSSAPPSVVETLLESCFAGLNVTPEQWQRWMNDPSARPRPAPIDVNMGMGCTSSCGYFPNMHSATELGFAHAAGACGNFATTSPTPVDPANLPASGAPCLVIGEPGDRVCLLGHSVDARRCAQNARNELNRGPGQPRREFVEYEDPTIIVGRFPSKCSSFVITENEYNVLVANYPGFLKDLLRRDVPFSQISTVQPSVFACRDAASAAALSNNLTTFEWRATYPPADSGRCQLPRTPIWGFACQQIQATLNFSRCNAVAVNTPAPGTIVAR